VNNENIYLHYFGGEVLFSPLFITPPPIGERSIVTSVSVCLCVCSRSYLRNYTPDFHQFLCMLPMAMARSSSGGVVMCYVLPVLWMTSYLLISQGCSTSPPSPAEAQCTRSLGLGYKLCAVIPVAGQRTHGSTFRALKVSSQVATSGAESAVYDCLVCLYEGSNLISRLDDCVSIY